MQNPNGDEFGDFTSGKEMMKTAVNDAATALGAEDVDGIVARFRIN